MSHQHGSLRVDRAFAIGLALNVAYVAVEAGAGSWTGSLAPTAHLVKPEVANEDGFLRQVKEGLAQRFGIEHAMLQIERGDGPTCRQAPHGRI